MYTGHSKGGPVNAIDAPLEAICAPALHTGQSAELVAWRFAGGQMAEVCRQDEFGFHQRKEQARDHYERDLCKNLPTSAFHK